MATDDLNAIRLGSDAGIALLTTPEIIERRVKNTNPADVTLLRRSRNRTGYDVSYSTRQPDVRLVDIKAAIRMTSSPVSVNGDEKGDDSSSAFDAPSRSKKVLEHSQTSEIGLTLFATSLDCVLPTSQGFGTVEVRCIEFD